MTVGVKLITISFLKEDIFCLIIKVEGGIAQGSSIHSTLKDFRNHMQTGDFIWL